MPKPSTITTWATDPGATADPGPTRRATGFIAGKKLPSKWLNWILNQNAAWLTYLRDLHTEPEFLDKVYAWTNGHSFSGALGAFNSFLMGPGVEAQYGTGLGLVATRQRTVIVPASAFQPSLGPAGASWHFQDSDAGLPTNMGPGWMSTFAPGSVLRATFQIPTGAILRSARAYVEINGPTTVRMSVGYEHVAGDAATAGSQHQTSESAARSASGVLTHTLVDGGPFAPQQTAPHDGAAVVRVVRFWTESSDNFTNATVKWLRIVFDDPGPRNF